MYLNANLLNYGTSDVDTQSFNTHIQHYAILYATHIKIVVAVTLLY
jgi:hypothetical protein